MVNGLWLNLIYHTWGGGLKQYQITEPDRKNAAVLRKVRRGLESMVAGRLAQSLN